MTVTITAFDWVPPFAQGLVRDLRLRWALEEVGQPYAVRYLPLGAHKSPEHRALHPFGQVPTYEEDGFVLFESGAIVLHIAERHAGLLPGDPDTQARAIQWMFAALNTIEWPIWERTVAAVIEGEKPWRDERLPGIEKHVRERLGELSDQLGDSDWLDGAFSAGDLMMVSVLRILRGALISEFPILTAYVARGESRPAFRRALDGQMAGFTGNPPPGWQ